MRLQTTIIFIPHNFRAKAKIKIYIEKHAKTYAFILLQQGKDVTILFEEVKHKKFVRGNWITHTDQFYTWERDVIQTQDTQKSTLNSLEKFSDCIGDITSALLKYSQA